jgi:hypothetical protein
MAEAEKSRSKPPVALRNTQRRPITFRVAGRTVRLSPRQRLEVPEAWLQSAELRRFSSMGAVVVHGAAGEGTDDSGGAAERDSGKPSRHAKSGRSKPDHTGD